MAANEIEIGIKLCNAPPANFVSEEIRAHFAKLLNGHVDRVGLCPAGGSVDVYAYIRYPADADVTAARAEVSATVISLLARASLTK